MKYPIFFDINKIKAAPSEVCDAFAAVTVPFCAKTGFNFPNASADPPFLGPSSVSAT